MRFLPLLLLVGCTELPIGVLRLDLETSLVAPEDREVFFEAGAQDGGPACTLSGMVEPRLTVTGFDAERSVTLTVDGYAGPDGYDVGVSAAVNWTTAQTEARGGLGGGCTATIDEGSASGTVSCDDVTITGPAGNAQRGSLWAGFSCSTLERFDGPTFFIEG